MNGERARVFRQAGRFATTVPGLAEIRTILFGERFRAGFGLRDPAYMPLHAHEAAEYRFSRGQKMWDKYHSAEELEAYIDQAPDIDMVGVDDNSQRWYDDAARLAAKWIKNRIRVVPAEARLVVTFWAEMESVFPRLAGLRLSTAQREWATAAAFRIFDAYRFDRELNSQR